MYIDKLSCKSSIKVVETYEGIVYCEANPEQLLTDLVFLQLA